MAQKKTTTLPNDSARNIAVNSLLTFERRQLFIQDTLDTIFRSGQLDQQQRRLATELAYGTCRRLITLDYLIRRHTRRSLRNIDPVIMQILRVGLYQLIYLAGTPDFAAVDEAVKQAKSTSLHGSDAFVNAILRSVQRDIEGATDEVGGRPNRSILWLDEQNGCQFRTEFLPDPARNAPKFYSVAHSHPPWLIERWLKRYDPQTVRNICLADNSRPSLMLRANSLRCDPDQLMARLTDAGIKARRLGPAIQLLQGAAPEELPGYAEGLFSIQDLTAMSVASMLEPLPGQRIVDLCAAPGTKTTHLAELMGNQGKIVACDIRPEKLVLIEQNCQRLGISIVETCLVSQLDEVLAQQGPFDAVLADVPCSNTGVLARRVEARHLLKPVHIRRLAQKQMQILTQAVALLKKPGKILYSTCSIEPAENELLTGQFLADNKSFILQAEKLSLPAVAPASEDAGSPETPGEPLPHDGGYVALLSAY